CCGNCRSIGGSGRRRCGDACWWRRCGDACWRRRCGDACRHRGRRKLVAQDGVIGVLPRTAELDVQPHYDRIHLSVELDPLTRDLKNRARERIAELMSPGKCED